MQVPRQVQKIDFIKVDYKMLDVHEQWQHDTYVPEQPIFTILPDGPTSVVALSRGGAGATVGLLDIACTLAKEATTQKEAKDLILTRLPAFLVSKQFVYSGLIHHTTLWPYEDENAGMIVGGLSNTLTSGEPDETFSAHQSFRYGGFMQGYNDPDTVWSGNCEDLSALTVMCASAVGANLNVKRCLGGFDPNHEVQTYEFVTNLVKPTAWKVNNGNQDSDCIFEQFRFRMHQVCCQDDQVWDPTLLFFPGTPDTLRDVDSATYFDTYLIAQGNPRTIYREIPILEVTW